MQVLVLGACGIQARAALYDLSKNESVDRITCADIEPGRIDSYDFVDRDRIRLVRLDVADRHALASVMDEQPDVVLDFLPPPYVRIVAEAAIQSGVHLVNTNYARDIIDLGHAARESDISIIAECGLDPGIDLVLYHHSLGYFDEVLKFNSYCGGIPEKAACDNALNYKISWNVDAMLNSQKRDATLIANGGVVRIPAEDQHDNAFIHRIEFPGLGTLEAIPNGDAAYYARLLNIADRLSETGRYALRWPGWSRFWNPLKKLGFLSDAPVKGLRCEVSPIEMVAKLLEPRLQYRGDEKDLCVMVNTLEGVKAGRRRKMTSSLLIERDPATGLMAMSMGVAYPACIAAGMLVRGHIRKRGLLSPVSDLPSELFLEELGRRGIKVTETIEDLG